MEHNKKSGWPEDFKYYWHVQWEESVVMIWAGIHVKSKISLEIIKEHSNIAGYQAMIQDYLLQYYSV